MTFFKKKNIYPIQKIKPLWCLALNPTIKPDFALNQSETNKTKPNHMGPIIQVIS
jgi:hypothetical protein